MAVGLAPAFMLAALGRGQHEAAGFDGARPQQHMPMGLAGDAGEGGRHHQDPRAGLGQATVERGEAQIVADRHAERRPGRLGDHRLATRREGRGFAIDLALAEIDVEHVDLVVLRGDFALGRQHIRAVGDPLAVFQQHRQRAGMQPEAGLARQFLEGGQRLVAFLRQRLGQDVLAAPFHHGDVLGHHHQLGAGRPRVAGQRRRGLDVLIHVVAGIDLYAGGFKIHFKPSSAGRAFHALGSRANRCCL